MSAESSAFDASPVNRDLSAWTRRSPAEQDRARDGEPEGPARTYYEDVIKVPGMDYQPERCRSLQPVGFCEESGHPVLGSSSCGVRGCPEHWQGDWLKRAVVNQVARLAAYRAAQEGQRRRTLHVVASPPQDWHWTVDRFWSARSTAYDVVKEAGVRGGVCIPHPYRTSDEGDWLFEALVEREQWDEERGHWSLFHDVAGGNWEEFQRYAEGAPHYHMIAPAEWLESEAAREGWVVKNVRSMGTFHVDDVESYRPMARTAYYLLTHGASQVGKHTVTYFGDVHPSSFNPEEELGARTWEKIQANAEKAVTTAPGGATVSTGMDAIECPHDGCESAVVALEELGDWMDDEEWFSGLDGRQRNQLRALEAWMIQGVDRPPPGKRQDREKLLRWLVQRGQVLTDYDRSSTGAGTSPGLLTQYAGD